MALLKNKTQGNFVIVSQNILRNKELNLAERGLLITLLSLPDNWNLSVRGLQEILPDGRDKIAHLLNRLIEVGYITKIQDRTEHGKFSTNILEVHEMPFPPCTENPDTDKPVTVEPSTGNTNQYSNKELNNNKSNNDKESEESLPDEDYEKLVSEYGITLVDYQIKRIKDRHYRGCLNYETIHSWCEELKARKPIPFPGSSASTAMTNQRQYDYDELERQLLVN